jgi:hypothetical protein
VKDPQFMQLDVTLPENVHGGVFPLTVRQLHKGHEIGRLTYLIELPKTLKGEGSAGKRSFKA